MRARLVIPLAAVALCACGTSYELSVDLQTSFQPGDEFDTVEVALFSGTEPEALVMESHPVVPGASYASGVRVTQIAGVSAGS